MESIRHSKVILTIVPAGCCPLRELAIVRYHQQALQKWQHSKWAQLLTKNLWGSPLLPAPIAKGYVDQASLLTRLFPLQKSPGQLETNHRGSASLHSQQCHHGVPAAPQHPALVSSTCHENVLFEFLLPYIFSLFFLDAAKHSQQESQSLLGVGNISRCFWKHLLFTACSLLQLNREESTSLP